MAVIWEVSLLSQRKRLQLGGRPRDFFDALFSNPAFQPLDLIPEQAFLSDEIRVNADPFDNLICAAALSLKLPLITADSAIAESGVVEVLGIEHMPVFGNDQTVSALCLCQYIPPRPLSRTNGFVCAQEISMRWA